MAVLCGCAQEITARQNATPQAVRIFNFFTYTYKRHNYSFVIKMSYKFLNFQCQFDS